MDGDDVGAGSLGLERRSSIRLFQVALYGREFRGHFYSCVDVGPSLPLQFQQLFSISRQHLDSSLRVLNRIREILYTGGLVFEPAQALCEPDELRNSTRINAKSDLPGRKLTAGYVRLQNRAMVG